MIGRLGHIKPPDSYGGSLVESDRELIASAAKMRGIPVVNGEPSRLGFAGWDPLGDDATEARLEAELEMCVEWHPQRRVVRVGRADVYAEEPYGNNRQSARRRAGVRAAGMLLAAQQGRGIATAL